MKIIALSVLLGIATLSAAEAPVPVAPGWRFFAPLGMTKMQVNSPAPDISGAFLRLPTGKWQHFGGDQIKWVNTLTVLPGDPRVVFIGCGNGILRSRDDGRTWRVTTDWHVADVFALQADPALPSRLYAGTGWGIWRSTDGGETWSEADRGLAQLGKFTQCLVVDRNHPSRLIAGTDLGLYVSGDGADSWARLEGAPQAPILHLEQSAADPRLWLAGTQGCGVLLSTDGGMTWATASAALARANVYGAAADPSDPGRMAAAGWAQGVEVSRDGGKSWVDATHGLPTAHVSALAFDRNQPGRLWASTFEEGTFYTDDQGKTWHLGGLYGAYVSELDFVPAPK